MAPPAFASSTTVIKFSIAPSCNPYPVGVYTRHAKRHQDILPKTPEPDRGPGPRPVENGRRGPLLHRYRHADIRRSGSAAARRGRSAQGSRVALRRTRDHQRQQDRPAGKDRGTDGRDWSVGSVTATELQFVKYSKGNRAP